MAEPLRTTDPLSPPSADGHPPVSDGDGKGPAVPPPGEPTVEAPSGRWQELRDLIVGPEQQRIERVERQLADPMLHVDEVSEVLPEAMERRARDGSLGRALGPVIGEAVKTSVRRNPQPLVDAIFPIIGPAIRRSIASAFSELVQSINTTVEHSLTPRGMAWRFEALRTGRSFGEVVLSHSLVYRVEQLFLVHRETGLLVEHLTAPGVKSLSPEMVAGMLTAITDFARDTFEFSRQEGVGAVALGDLTVWTEEGPVASLSAVIRGHAPVAFREEMQRAVEGVHRVHMADLERFGSAGTPFEVRPDLLEACLVAQVNEPSRSRGWWRLLFILALILLGVGWCAVPRYLEGRRFDRYVGALRQEPGVVVGSTGRADGRFVVSGLRDPLARDPRTLLAAAGVDSTRVDAHWEPYVALRPEFVLRRAGNALQAPATVQLMMRGDTLAASGVASAEWIADARRIAVAVGGVGAVDFSAVQDSAVLALRASADSLEQLEVRFARGEAFPVAGYRPVMDSMTAGLARLLASAAAANREIVVESRASTDSVGSAETNSALRVERARTLKALLTARGIPAEAVTINPDSAISGRRASLRIAVRPLR